MNIFLIITEIVFVLYCLLLFIYRLGFKKALRNKRTEDVSQELRFFTVIIPARNEAANIAACLHSILANDYPTTHLEIILIDDFSEDETFEIAQNILKPPHQILRLKDYIAAKDRINAFKKYALNLAISKAKGDYIVTTDADCLLPKNWLKTLSKGYQNHDIHFVAAPVDFVPFEGKKSWLYYFQSLDFMTMQGITIAANQFEMGHMCNGANLSFKKATFYAVDGYKGVDQIASGDDMMLMHKINAQYPKSIHNIIDKAAIVTTPVQPDFRSFLNQRIRWASKSDKYQEKRLIYILGIVYLLNLFLAVLLIYSLWQMQYFSYFLLILLGKIGIELFFLFPVATFFNKKKELIWFALLQPIHILYVIAAGFLGKFGTYSWKGRMVK